MNAIPQHRTVIHLSQGDVNAAIEYWLNAIVLKAPCAVTQVTEMATSQGGKFEITFDRTRDELTESTGE